MSLFAEPPLALSLVCPWIDKMVGGIQRFIKLLCCKTRREGPWHWETVQAVVFNIETIGEVDLAVHLKRLQTALVAVTEQEYM